MSAGTDGLEETGAGGTRMSDPGGTSAKSGDVQKAMADIDEVLGFRTGPGGANDLRETAARLTACIERCTPVRSVYRRLADAVRIVDGKVSKREESRLRGVLTAFRQELVGETTASSSTQNEPTWLASIQAFPSEIVASQAVLLKTVEREKEPWGPWGGRRQRERDLQGYLAEGRRRTGALCSRAPRPRPDRSVRRRSAQRPAKTSEIAIVYHEAPGRDFFRGRTSR
jgi:hypothetical protein